MTNSNNTMRTIKTIATSAFLAVLFFGCGGTAAVLSTPIENIDTSPLKVSELTEAEKHNWGHLDLVKDTIPGMSVDKAYAEIIKNRKGKKVIVAVIDSGIDIDHEDLNDPQFHLPQQQNQTRRICHRMCLNGRLILALVLTLTPMACRLNMNRM